MVPFCVLPTLMQLHTKRQHIIVLVTDLISCGILFYIEMDNAMSPVHSVPEVIITNTTPSTSTTQPRKVPPNRPPTSTSTLNTFASAPSTSTVSSSNRNRSRKQKNLNKDLGRWKPTDDLMLIQSVLQVILTEWMNK